MMKKLLLLGSAVFAMNLSVNAQKMSVKAENAPAVSKSAVIDFTQPSTITGARTASTQVIGDTLSYFFNKHFYRNPASTGFYTYMSPNSGTVQLTHHGSRFYNSGTLAITGLECLAARNASSPSAGVTIRMYLCNVSANLPIFPAIDSLNVVATGTAGAFRGANWTIPKIVTGDFAVLFKCIPTLPGDSVRLFMNNAMTATATTGPASAKYGEGLGVFRAFGQFDNTTDLFGPATDYEYIVAPRVVFTATTSFAAPTLSALCTGTNYVFSNTSSPYLSHRQYNLNEFYRVWKPFANAGTTIAADSVFTWNFGDGTADRFTASGVNTISKVYNTVGNYTGTLTSMYQKMADFGDPSLADSFTASKTTSNCVAPTNTNVTTSVAEVSGFQNVNVFPNPTVNGKTIITGLSGSNTVMVYDMLGQLVATQTSDKETISLDLINRANGNYIVKIINSSNAVKVMKIINQN